MVRALHREEELIHLVGDLLEIDAEGRIWRTRPIRKRAENQTGTGYLQIRAMLEGTRWHVLAHRLVWRHFVGPIPGQMTINHRNGIKTDNHPGNLELATMSEQAVHATHVLGVRPRLLDQNGEKNAAAKLTDTDVMVIRHRYAIGGVTQAALAKEYGVSFQAISKIVRGERRTLQPGPTADYVARRSLGGGSH